MNNRHLTTGAIFTSLRPLVFSDMHQDSSLLQYWHFFVNLLSDSFTLISNRYFLSHNAIVILLHRKRCVTISWDFNLNRSSTDKIIKKLPLTFLGYLITGDVTGFQIDMIMLQQSKFVTIQLTAGNWNVKEMYNNWNCSYCY